MASDANSEPLSINVIGDVSDETFKGDFRVKIRLSHKDQLVKDQRRRELLGPQTGPSTERALSTAMILSELYVRVLTAPKWFEESDRGLELVDDNVLSAIYDGIEKILADKEEAKKKKAEEAKVKMKADLVAEMKAEGELPPDEK